MGLISCLHRKIIPGESDQGGKILGSPEEKAEVRRVDGQGMEQRLLMLSMNKHRDLAIAELILGNAFQQCMNA